ncbi:MAG: hypothetical protein QXW35_04220 [Candidatus Aenigmatarchaeota archaeon]
MSNKNNNKQNNIDLTPILNSLENINNTLKTIANVFYEQNNQNNNQQKRIEDTINRQLNLFRDVASTFRNVLQQMRREEEEQRRDRQQNNQNNNQQQSFIRSSLKSLISALRGIGRYQIATFQSIDRFLKVENEFKTRQAREINNLIGRLNNNSQKFFKQFIQEIDEIYNEKNYFKSMADSLKHIAEVHILLKPFIRNMVARGINPLCCGTGLGGERGFDQLLHIGGEDIQTNLAKVLRYARFGTIIEEDISSILTNIERGQHPYRKFFSKIPLIGRFALNDEIRLLKAAQSGVLQNFLQTTYFNLNERILERFFSFDIRRRERIQNELLQLIRRYTDKQGRIDETVLANLGNNINRLTNYIETFNRYSQYFTNTDKFSINRLLIDLDKQFVLQTRFLESLENVTQDLEVQMRAYNTTLQNQLSEDTLRDINNLLRSVVLRDIARGRISDANLNEINTMIENILRQRNLSEEQIRIFLNLVSNTYSTLATNYGDHLRDAIERELQYRGISRKTIDDLAKRLGSEYAYLAEDVAKNMILRKSKTFNLTNKLLNNTIYKWLESIALSMAFRSFFLFKIPFIGPALASLGFPWNIAVGLLFAPIIYKRGAIISFMVRQLTPLIQRGFGRVQQLVSKYIPDSVKDFFNTVTTNVKNIITKFKQSRFWNNTFMFKLRTVIGTSIGNIFRSLLGFDLRQPSQPVQPEIIQKAYTGESIQTLNLQQNQNNIEAILNNLTNTVNNLSNIINNIGTNINQSGIIQAITNLQNSINQSLNNIHTSLNKHLIALQDYIEFLPYVLSDIYNTLQNDILQYLNKIQTTLSNLKNYANNNVNNIINIDLSNLVQILNEIQNSFVQSLNNLQNNISQYANNLFTSLQNQLDSIISNTSNISQYANNLFTSLQNQLDSIISNTSNISHILNNINNNLQNLKGVNLDETFKQGLSDNIRLIGETLENINIQSVNIDNKLQTLDDSLNRLYNQYAIKKDGIDSLKVYVTNFKEFCDCIRNKSAIPPIPGMSSFIGSSMFGFGDPISLLALALFHTAPFLIRGASGILRLGWRGLKWAGRKSWEGLKWIGSKGKEGLKIIGSGLKSLGSKGWEGLKWIGSKGKEGLKIIGSGLKSLGSKGLEGIKAVGSKGLELVSRAAGSNLVKSAASTAGRVALSRAAGAAIGGLIGGPVGLVAGLVLPSAISYATNKLFKKDNKNDNGNQNLADTNKAQNIADTNVNNANASVTQYDFTSLYNVLQTQVEYQKQTNTILNNIHNTLQTMDTTIQDISKTLKNRSTNNNKTQNIIQNNNITSIETQQSTSIMDRINQLIQRLGF